MAEKKNTAKNIKRAAPAKAAAPKAADTEGHAAATAAKHNARDIKRR